MNSRPLHIRCLDEGHGPVDVVPFEEGGTTALMINPKATTSVLLDAAKARTERIVDVTNLFISLEYADFDFSREEACRLLTTVSAMAYEVCRLLVAAQTVQQPKARTAELEMLLLSYRQTVEASEALIHTVNAADLKRPVPVAKRAAIDDAVLEMKGHCDAARDDFLGGPSNE